MTIRVPAILALALIAAACASQSTTAMSPALSDPSDTVEARRVFEENIDAIHKRNRERYLATYIHTPTLARNGPDGLQLGYEGWSARRDSTWPDTQEVLHKYWGDIPAAEMRKMCCENASKLYRLPLPDKVLPELN